jgi:hypothetical protein
MRARTFVMMAAVALAGAGCTAVIAAGLASTNGTTQHYVGGCFKLADTTCGQCIANNCEDPTNPTQPVSLAKVCQLDQYATIISSAQDCSGNDSIGNYNCQDMFIDGGNYATSIDNEQAAVNNLKQCITRNCLTSCSRCAVDVPTCGSATIDLLEAGACATCIDNAMNTPGGSCQSYVLQGSCPSYQGDPVAQCAIPAGSCQSADCTDMKAPDASALYQCLANQCGGQCPSQ